MMEVIKLFIYAASDYQPSDNEVESEVTSMPQKRLERLAKFKHRASQMHRENMQVPQHIEYPGIPVGNKSYVARLARFNNVEKRWV